MCVQRCQFVCWGVNEHAKEESLAEQRKKSTYRHPHMGCRHTHTRTHCKLVHTIMLRTQTVGFFLHYFTVALVFGIFEGEKKKENIYKPPVKKEKHALTHTHGHGHAARGTGGTHTHTHTHNTHTHTHTHTHTQ